ncbi:hypothetical protein VTL71DRAFT_14743 [Oculimacula yallundae]|uniref:Uncharacterized protein n=1 Tax=Oculimacula yallundae TaxID=86028 RepID=A0ABR4CJH3_9HELO
MVERVTSNDEVAGSIPSMGILCFNFIFAFLDGTLEGYIPTTRCWDDFIFPLHCNLSQVSHKRKVGFVPGTMAGLL